MYNKIFYLLIIITLVSCSKKEPKHKRPPPPVEIAEVIQKDVPITIDAVGNVQAWNTIEVRSQVTGVLKKAHVAEGQNVEEGQLIYTIDPDPYIASLAKAEAQLMEDIANLQLAEDKVERYKDLAAQDYISQLDFDELVTNVELMKAKIEVSKAQIAEAKIQLDYCYIHSPVEGKISYNVFQPGNLITANSQQALTSIRQMNPVFVDFTIPQKEFLKLQQQHEGNELKFLYHMLDTDGNQVTKEGTIYFIDNNLDLNTGTIQLRGKIENTSQILWPGEFGKVQLIIRTVKNGLLIPQEAVQVGQKGNFIYILQDDQTVKAQPIDSIEEFEGFVLVKEGVKVGEKVVTNGQLNLQSGMTVQVRKPSTEQKENGTTKA